MYHLCTPTLHSLHTEWSFMEVLGWLAFKLIWFLLFFVQIHVLIALPFTLGPTFSSLRQLRTQLLSGSRLLINILKYIENWNIELDCLEIQQKYRYLYNVCHVSCVSQDQKLAKSARWYIEACCRESWRVPEVEGSSPEMQAKLTARILFKSIRQV